MIAGITRMQARCRSAKVSPCSGCVNTNAVVSAVTAAMPQRTAPARPARAIAPAGLSTRTKDGPMTKNTTTSAATDADHSRLAVRGKMSAALQRMTAKVSCMAWLPRISAATSTTRRNTGMRNRAATLSLVIAC